MSLYDYRASRVIAQADYPYYSLIMAAMRKADTPNTQKLRAAWPEVWDELQARYNAPGGILVGEPDPAELRIDSPGLEEALDE